jgi:hypothetical protein
MKTLILILCAAAAFAQGGVQATHVIKTSTASMTADKLTVQQSQTNPAVVRMVAGVVECTVAGTVTVLVGGTAPTATSATPSPVNPGGTASVLTAYTSSDVGTGTAVSVAYSFSANVPFTLDLTHISFSGLGTTRNVSLSIATGSSATCKSALYWKEN